jgi:pimeloyl-ACP methyl ester carboxylesterase
MQIVVDSLLTHYEVRGEGKVVLLLPGWGDTTKSFRTLQAQLSTHYKTIALDLPGFGQTEAPKTVWGLDDYAQFIASFLGKARMTNVWAVVGHSNGGAIAIRGVSHQVIPAQRLVLMASAGIRGLHKKRLTTIRIITKAGKIITKPLPQSLQRQLRQKVYERVGSDMLVVEHLKETFKRIVAEDVREDATSLALPTLLIYGDQDGATPLSYGQEYARLVTHSTLEVIPGGTHFLQLDYPQEVANLIKRFLV